MAVRLRDPDRCRLCAARGEVFKSLPRSGYRIRRYRCPNAGCRARWTTYESLLNPRRVELKV